MMLGQVLRMFSKRIIYTEEMLEMKINQEKVTSHYKFLKEIGRGASGICYKVSSRNDSKDFRCVKKVRKEAEVPYEAVLLEQMAHPNILRLYEVFMDEQNYYFVLDLCEGGELFDYLELKGGLSEHEAKEIFIQIISAVKYCHDRKICHRDLKPQNFILADQVDQNSIPDIKLIDFDLSFQWKKDMPSEIMKKEGKRIIGTPYYIAPEIIQGSYDHKCDIWSAGVILHILVSGLPPFNGGNPKQILKSVMAQKYTLDIPEMADVSLLAKDLIKKILAPAQKRITIEEIFNHPWMRIPPKKLKLKIDFSQMACFSKFSKLKEMVAIYIASKQSAKENSELTRVFKALDTNMDGYLSVDELKAALGSDDKSNAEVKNLLQFVETDKNGMMNYTEFIASFVKEQSIQSKENLRQVFEMIDKDGNGTVESEELTAILRRQGFERSPLQEKKVAEEVNKILKSADKNNDGKIDFEEFVETVCKQIDR